MLKNYYRSLQLLGSTPEFGKSVKGLRNSKGMSGTQITTAIWGMSSGPWWVSGLKWANCHGIVLTSKDKTDKVGLFLICSWGKSLTIAGAMKRANIVWTPQLWTSGLAQTLQSAKLRSAPQACYQKILLYKILKVFWDNFKRHRLSFFSPKEVPT